MAASKQALEPVDVGILKKKQLNELEFRKQYPIKFAASGNYNDREDINWTWENITRYKHRN